MNLEYPSQIQFMEAHIEALEAELKFFRSAFPRAAENYKKVSANQVEQMRMICSCGSPDFYDDKVFGVVCCRCQALRT